MMYQKKSGRSAWLKYALALPVLFVLKVVFANHSRSIIYPDNYTTIELSKDIHSSCDGMKCSTWPALFLENTIENQLLSGTKNNYYIIPEYFKSLNKHYDPSTQIGIYINEKRITSSTQLPIDFSKPWAAKFVQIINPELSIREYGIEQGVIKMISPTNDLSFFDTYEQEFDGEDLGTKYSNNPNYLFSSKPYQKSNLSTNPYTCESSDIQLFTEVDQEPYFSEYDRILTSVDEIHESAFNNLNQYLFNHISSDIDLFERMEGKWIEVNMTITKNGKINDLTIPFGIDQRANQKLLYLFRDLNKKDMPFIPAIKDGETVSAIMTIPFMFVEDGQGLIHLPFKRFKADKLKRELDYILVSREKDRRTIKLPIEETTKKYLNNYPEDHREIISSLFIWGLENGYRIQPITESIIIKGYSQKGNYPITDIESLTLDISTMNRDNLKFSHSVFEDFNNITKDNIKELIHVIYDNKPSSSQCLKDFLKFSYPHRDRNDLQEIIIERFKEVLNNEGLTVYQDFENLKLSINTKLPDELLSLSNYSIDEENMPIIWTQEFDNSQLLEDFINFDKPIKAIYHLPAEEATKIFGERGNKGFYALMGYERPRTHPIKQKKMLEYELDNFYTTLKHTNERGWVTKLKEVHQQLQEKYPKVGDWITPFTTRAHKHGIMLVIKNDEIIKAYKESNSGYDQIDRTNGANLQEVLNDMALTGRKYYSEHGIEDPMDMHSYSSVLNRYNSETPPLITVNGVKIENHDFIKKLKTNQENYSFTYWQPDDINIKTFGLDALYGHLEINDCN